VHLRTSNFCVIYYINNTCFQSEGEVFHMDTSALNAHVPVGQNKEQEESDIKHREARTSNGKILSAFGHLTSNSLCIEKNDNCNYCHVY